MDEIMIRHRISQAMNEPSAPEGLVHRTIVRVKAIEAGQQAERELGEMKNVDDPKRIRALVARSTIGRLMQANAPPDEVGVERLERELIELPAFCTLASRPVNQVLEELQNGKFTAQLSKALHKSNVSPQHSRKQTVQRENTPRIP